MVARLCTIVFTSKGAFAHVYYWILTETFRHGGGSHCRRVEFVITRSFQKRRRQSFSKESYNLARIADKLNLLSLGWKKTTTVFQQRIIQFHNRISNECVKKFVGFEHFRIGDVPSFESLRHPHWTELDHKSDSSTIFARRLSASCIAAERGIPPTYSILDSG